MAAVRAISASMRFMLKGVEEAAKALARDLIVAVTQQMDGG